MEDRMKIVCITPFLVREWRTMLFVRIETDDGIEVVGEARLTSREVSVEALATLLVGRGAMRTEHHWKTRRANGRADPSAGRNRRAGCRGGGRWCGRDCQGGHHSIEDIP